MHLLNETGSIRLLRPRSIEQAGLEIVELQVIWGEIWTTISPEGQL